MKKVFAIGFIGCVVLVACAFPATSNIKLTGSAERSIRRTFELPVATSTGYSADAR